MTVRATMTAVLELTAFLARAHLVQDRTRCWQRLEKLLEGA